MSGPFVTPVHGTGSDRSRWHFDFYNQWPNPLELAKYSWLDFTLIDIAGEFSPYKGSCELTLALLGLRLTVTYVYDLPRDEELEKRANETLAGLNRASDDSTVTPDEADVSRDGSTMTTPRETASHE